MKPLYWYKKTVFGDLCINLSIFGLSILSGTFNKQMGWVRVFGYGIAWKNLKHHSLTFSQRYGYRKYIRLGNMVLTFLKR